MQGDGPSRKVKRLDVLQRFIANAGDRGRSWAQIEIFGERTLGLSKQRVQDYVRLLRRSREIKELKGRWYDYNLIVKHPEKNGN